jgi:DNA invertase Pin-like site-specific DNA recombinase
MFRSAIDALGVLSELKKRGISLHMIDLGGDTTGNGVSKLVFTILSAVAEAERDRTRERFRRRRRISASVGAFWVGACRLAGVGRVVLWLPSLSSSVPLRRCGGCTRRV